MTASVILGACLPQKPPASTARPNPYRQRPLLPCHLYPLPSDVRWSLIQCVRQSFANPMSWQIGGKSKRR